MNEKEQLVHSMVSKLLENTINRTIVWDCVDNFYFYQKIDKTKKPHIVWDFVIHKWKIGHVAEKYILTIKKDNKEFIYYETNCITNSETENLIKQLYHEAYEQVNKEQTKINEVIELFEENENIN